MTDHHMELRPATLDDAQAISIWVASRDELLVFAGPSWPSHWIRKRCWTPAPDIEHLAGLGGSA